MSDPPVLTGRLIIVCGLPGSGKSTTARRLEDEHEAIRLCPDDWMAALAIDIFDEPARGRIEQLQWSLAQRFLQLGRIVVIEWGNWRRDERDALRAAARAQGAAVELRFLDAPIDELWERVRVRDRERHLGHRALTRSDLEDYATAFQRPDAAELALYDPPLDVSR